MDAIRASCLEAVKTARAQSFDSAPLVPANEPPLNEEQSFFSGGHNVNRSRAANAKCVGLSEVASCAKLSQNRTHLI
jgi:hypothetical protein